MTRLAVFLAGAAAGAAALYLVGAVGLARDELTLLDRYLATENR